MFAWTLVFHIIGIVFWIGGLLVVTSILNQHVRENSEEAREALGRLELRVFKGMANPGAAIAVITGIILIFTNRSYYLYATWLHVKLALVAILIVLHLVTFFRTSGFATGRIEIHRREVMILHAVISLIFLGILVCVLPGRLIFT